MNPIVILLTCLVDGVALLRRSGDGSEIRRDNAWLLPPRNPRDRANWGFDSPSPHYSEM